MSPSIRLSAIVCATALGVCGLAGLASGCSDTATAVDAPATGDDASTQVDITTETTVTPAGGTFTVGGATVTIPAGAVTADTKVALRLTSDTSRGTGLAGGTIATDALVATPHGTTFAAPVVIELPMKTTGTGTPTVMTLSDDNDATWESMPGAQIVNNRFRFETLHFSWMIGFYTPPQEEAGADSGSADAGPKKTPECASFVNGTTKDTSSPTTLVGDRLYWFGTVDDKGAIHTAKTDLTDHKQFADQGGVRSISSNANGVYWFNTFPPQDAGVTAGLYKLASSTSTPSLLAPLFGTPSLVAAAPSNLFFVTATGPFDRALVRTNAEGQSNESLYGGGFLPDSLRIFGNYIYWHESTIVANASACAGSKLAAVVRLPLGAAAQTAPEVVVNACDLLDATSAEAGVSDFTIAGNDYYVQTNRGMKIWKGSLSGGKPVKLHEPAFAPKTGGGRVVAVGAKLVFSEISTVSTPDNGLRTVDLQSGAVGPLFADIYPFTAGDGTHIYNAAGGGFCRIAVPQ